MPEKTVLYQLDSQSPVQMMSYVVQTKQGSLVVIDGGNVADAPFLLQFLTKLAGGIPTVEGWFLTHAHSDHIDAFMTLIKEHPSDLQVKNVYANFPPQSFIDSNEHHEAHTIREFEALMPDLPQLHTMHQGERYCIDDVTIDVMLEPDLSVTQNAINNSAVVLRMEAGGQRVMFLADLGIEGGERLLAAYTQQELQCEMVQMAHHGQSGVNKSVYEAIAPRVCLWSTPQWLWDNNAGEGYDTAGWQTIIVQGWMKDMGIVHHFISKDGTAAIELPFEQL